MTLNTSRRHVIATSGPDRYLVSLSVTTSVDQAVAAADATDADRQGLQGQHAGPACPQRRARRRPPASPLASPWPAGLPGGPPGTTGISVVPRAKPGARGTPQSRDACGPRIVWRMLIAAVLCLCAAVATAAVGLWLLTRPHSGDLRPAGAAGRRTDPAGRRRDAGRRRCGGAVHPPRNGPAGGDRVRRRRGEHRRGRLLAERQGGRARPSGAAASVGPACEGTAAARARPARCPATEFSCG